MLTLLPDREAAARIGRAYLDHHTLDRLDVVRHFAEQLALTASHLSALTDDELRERLTALVRGAYARGELVAVEGWLLARPEAQLCALAAMRASERA